MRKEKRTHQFSYNLYHQLLGIIEDESQDQVNNPNQTPERDYEMEAPYQHVTTHLLSVENSFETGRSKVTFNAGYQYNKRSEFEPDSLPKSKFLGVGVGVGLCSSGGFGVGVGVKIGVGVGVGGSGIS